MASRTLNSALGHFDGLGEKAYMWFTCHLMMNMLLHSILIDTFTHEAKGIPLIFFWNVENFQCLQTLKDNTFVVTSTLC
nr:hypothetical protein [Tanacetum cinerariifolium]